MKRFILSLTAAAVLSMPMAASALDKMDNNQLKSATGQAGVSIAVDDVVIYQKSLADTTYWDVDGVGDGMGAAGVMIDHADEMEKLITINAILDDAVYGVSQMDATFGTGTSVGIVGSGSLDGTPQAANGYIAGNTTGISPLTIDVGTCETLTLGWEYNNAMSRADVGAVGGVIIGLPTVEIATYTNHDFKSVKLATGVDNGDGTVDSTSGGGYMNATHNTFITIEKSGDSTMAILGGQLEIAPH